VNPLERLRARKAAETTVESEGSMTATSDQTAMGRMTQPYGQHDAILPPPPDEALDGAPIPVETRLRMYELQQEIRQVETELHRLFLMGLVQGTSHLYTGMEATASAFGALLRPDDYSFATYRGHGHTLARGASMEAVFGEMLGRSTGLLGGKGGSMHLTSVEHGMLGSYAIIGAHLCIANGAAWSAKYRGTDQVAVAFFGDGTTNIGAFHEALNFAAVYDLPTIFVCENNLYMEYTPIGQITAVEHPAADRASAYGLEPIVVDGNDADAVYLTAKAAIDKARSGGGPTLIESLTYRHGGHSRADPGTYRPSEEIEAWKDRDPIPLYHQRLLRLGIEESTLTGIETDVARRVTDAAEDAKAAPRPDESVIFTNVYADGGAQWRS
jgi:pyruvate dehydrogenase E1 component alpha subunit